MAFEKDDFIEDINYLWDKYKIPLFIMPVDLEYNYIRNTPAFFAKAKRYMLAVQKTITYFRTPERKHRILNLTNRDFWDIKTPPI